MHLTVDNGTRVSHCSESMLRVAHTGCRSLHRQLGWWPPAFCFAWILVTGLQEPEFFRRLGIPFYWSGVEAALILILAALPLLWVLAEGRDALDWIQTKTGSASRTVLTVYTTILTYGGLLIALALVTSVALDRICGQPFVASAPLQVLRHSTAWLLCVAAFTPLLAKTARSITVLCSCWLLLILGLSVFVLPTRDTEGALWGVLPVIQAGFGGLLVSAGVMWRHHRKDN